MEHLSKAVVSIIKKRYGKGEIPSFTSVHLTMDRGDLGGEMGWNTLFTDREVVPGTGLSRTTYVSEVSDDIIITWTELGSPDGYNSMDVTIVHPVTVNVDTLVVSLSEITSDDEGEESDEESQFYLYRPSLNEGEVNLIPVDVPALSVSPEEFFTEKFLSDIHVASGKMKENGTGLTLICGPKNTGKTTIVTMLPDLTERTCVFIPNNMIDVTFGNPLFYDILDEIRNPVLILDDTENHFRMEMQSQNAITNNILQLLEGPVDRNIHLVIVSNDNVNKMDRNITRSRSVKNILVTSKETVKYENNSETPQKGIRL